MITPLATQLQPFAWPQDGGQVAYLNLGTSLIALGRCQEAASVLREGTKLDGAGLRDRAAHENARISALLQLGNLYADQGKLQRALAIYREALHTLPERYPPQTSCRSPLVRKPNQLQLRTVPDSNAPPFINPRLPPA
uniref:TPR_REGION domain-containing protein n=1 Tax=Anopheles melas TaxID=34690 RepID=A0A182THI7_9DIPT